MFVIKHANALQQWNIERITPTGYPLLHKCMTFLSCTKNMAVYFSTQITNIIYFILIPFSWTERESETAQP